MDYYNPRYRNQRKLIEQWDTFRLAVERFRKTRTLDRYAISPVRYVIEGLVRLGRKSAAQALAVEVLAIAPPVYHEDVRAALNKRFFAQELGVLGGPARYRRKVRLLLWVERERLFPTWP